MAGEYFAEGLAGGIERASQTLLNVYQAKEKMGREREMHDLKKKELKLCFMELLLH